MTFWDAFVLDKNGGTFYLPTFLLLKYVGFCLFVLKKSSAIKILIL